MSEPVARLIERRQARTKVHELGLGRHVVGRGGTADVLVDHVDVSREHAELDIALDGATIRDLGSKNGLRIDSDDVAGQTVALDDGSRIGFGELVLVLDHPGARIGGVLLRSGEVTVRRPSSALAHERAVRAAPRNLLAPGIAALAFLVMLTLLLVFG